MLMMIIAAVLSLNGEWNLQWKEDVEGEEWKGGITATVPGNCELDLIHAGILPPAEIGMNVTKLLPYEGYEWRYAKQFKMEKIGGDGERYVLRFNGIDTLADIYLNGKKVGETANMLIPHEFIVTSMLREGDNTLEVIIHSIRCAAQYATIGEIGHSMGAAASGADGEPFRKAAHMGGWDIFPRIFCAGLWRGVELEAQKPVRIDQPAWIIRELGKTWANMLVSCRVQAPWAMIAKNNLTIRYSISRDGKLISESRESLRCYQHQTSYWNVNGIERWWPKGMGEQPLYDAKIEVIDSNGSVLAENAIKFGFRTIRLERDDVYGKDRPGQFLFRVNGEPCYIRGSNWVPLDSFHCRDMEHMLPTLEMFNDLNCNMVRVWGGGVYEPEEFFDYCDAHGIMVWQDFMTGCSVFPQNDEYAKATEEEVRSVVLRFRNRASLALWSGNNENDGAFHWKLGKYLARDPNHDRNSRKTIPDVLFEFDVTRDYLPSSPYESPDVIAGKAEASEMHLWGARAYYKVPFYTNSPCWFASEMGYHGCPNRETIERMMTKGNVYPWAAITGDDPKKDYHWNDEWTLKASDPDVGGFGQRRNSLMTNQIKLMFGGVNTNLDAFIEQSQFVQAEAMKTFCELFRSRKFTRFNGLIWWNVRDGWPQISDAVVDYYGGRKRAYHALWNAQRDQIVCVVDDHTAWAVNDELHPVKGNARLTDVATGKVLLERDFEIPANGKLALGSVPFTGQGVVKIEATLGGKPYRNHFLYGEPPFDWGEVKAWMNGL